MSAITFSGMVSGAKGEVVRVETQLARGLPYFIVVGLADTAVKESRERVKVAIQSSGLEFPRFRKVVNLAPAHIKKSGSQFDLAIAVGVLRASKQVMARDILETSVFIGELALDGHVRGVRGTLAIAEAARDAGYKCVFVGSERVREACLVKGIRVFAPKDLRDLMMHLKGEKLLHEATGLKFKPAKRAVMPEVKGHEIVKRAIEIAASGRHHIALVGPPGMGKSLLARSISGLLPSLRDDEVTEVVRMYSIFTDRDFADGEISRPYREVSHTISLSALTGGGAKLSAGEMSLAHKGVLLMDDIHNFSKAQIEAMLKPMEERKVFVTSGKKKLEMPADFMLVATMNPCPCGKRGLLNDGDCKCKEGEINRFVGKFPQAFWDRMDMVIEVPELDESDFDEIVKSTRKHRALSRFNGELTYDEVEKECVIKDSAKDLLIKALQKKMVSGRGYFNALKVARTIADLEGHEEIESWDVAEALSFRKSGI